MKKKVVIIGRGTAGSQAVAHYLKYMPEYEIEWYYDPNIKVQSVGEGSTLQLPVNLFHDFNFNYLDLEKIDGTIKLGIYKSGWGNNKEDFLHQFGQPYASLHFNAVLLQEYIMNKVKDRVSIIESNVKAENIDADYIIDCSGKSDLYDDFFKSKYIPVNAAYIAPCYWEHARFNYTLTIARPYGWVFGIPLNQRCSIGYLFNRNINNIEEVKEDVKNVFEEYNLVPSENTNYLEFNNYYRKKNYTDRIAYSGNSSFFLEPIEANSIEIMDFIQRQAFDLWTKKKSVEESNVDYRKNINGIETMIMLHYYAGSNYETDFWEFAQKRGQHCIEESLIYNNDFNKIITHTLKKNDVYDCDNNLNYGNWPSSAYYQNIHGLGIKNKLLELLM
jgi:hypothetical protein